jgi:hypothetical protein
MDDCQALSPDDDRLVRRRLDAAVRGLDQARLSALSWLLAARLLELTDPPPPGGPPAPRDRARRRRAGPGDREGTWTWWGLAAVMVLSGVLALVAAAALPPADQFPSLLAGAGALAAAALLSWLGSRRTDDELLLTVLLAPYLLIRDVRDLVRQPVAAVDEVVDDVLHLTRRLRRRWRDERLRARARRAARGLHPQQLRALVALLDGELSERADPPEP